MLGQFKLKVYRLVKGFNKKVSKGWSLVRTRDLDLEVECVNRHGNQVMLLLYFVCNEYNLCL
jgi:hypothetical protein